jgi:hypothetical protein
MAETPAVATTRATTKEVHKLRIQKLLQGCSEISNDHFTVFRNIGND